MKQRKVLFFLAAACTAATADASVSIALSIDELVRPATVVARVVPLESKSAWEDGRIVTTTVARVERTIAGAAPTTEIRIRTLGGRVGEIGQIAEGEAVLQIDQPSVVFLAPRESRMTVVGRAQGQLLVTKEADQEVVRLAPAGKLVARAFRVPLAPQTELAASLDHMPVDDAAQKIARSWEKTHAR